MNDPGAWIRAARRSRMISQRELAAAAGVPYATVARAESGRSVPHVATFTRLLGAAGYGLVLLDRHGRPLAVDEEHDRIRDRAGRRFPAHLDWSGKPEYEDGTWWGYHRIAWAGWSNVPEHVFFHRPRVRAHQLPWRAPLFPGEIGRPFDDAT